VRLRGGEELIRPGELTVIGELHGSCEAPAVVLAFTREAASRGDAVRVGLEIFGDEQPRIDAFLRDGDRAKLLDGPFWRRPFQDGRSSEAMVRLLDDLRQLGGDVGVFAFDAEPDGDGRDAAMAACVARQLDAAPRAVFLILVGNVHARTVRGGVPWDPDYAPMAALLAERFALRSFDLEFRRGTAWVATDPQATTGSVHSFTGADRGDEPGVILHAAPDEAGYHGLVYVVELTASLPAVR